MLSFWIFECFSFLCFDKLPLAAVAYPQMSHLYGFSPVWMFLCSFNWPLYLGCSTFNKKKRHEMWAENSLNTLTSTESFSANFTAIGTIICVTLSMNFKIFLQVSGVRTFGTFEDLGFVSMNSLIVLIQSRLSIRFTIFYRWLLSPKERFK